MKTSLVVLTLCAFAVAMVPLERRALNPDDGAPAGTTTSTSNVICSPTTPCAWSTLNSVKMIELNITNSYCTCSADTECKMWKEDFSGNVITYRCMPPGVDVEEGAES